MFQGSFVPTVVYRSRFRALGGIKFLGSFVAQGPQGYHEEANIMQR
jgi:hypothetical protein